MYQLGSTKPTPEQSSSVRRPGKGGYYSGKRQTTGLGKQRGSVRDIQMNLKAPAQISIPEIWLDECAAL